MKRFHVNQRPDEKFIEVKKKVKTCKAIQIDEEFNVGTSNGIQHGKAGDWLLMDESCLSVVGKEDFEKFYEVVKPKRKPADINKDGRVDEKDLSEVHKEYSKEKKKPTAKSSKKEIYQKPKAVKKSAPKKVAITSKKKVKK